MSLSQAALDRIAQAGAKMYGRVMEPVTYQHKASAADPVEVSTVQVHMQGYRENQIDQEVILRTDVRARVKTAGLAFTPTQYDVFVRADGSVWRIIHIEGGSRHPWWFLQCRKVG